MVGGEGGRGLAKALKPGGLIRMLCLLTRTMLYACTSC